MVRISMDCFVKKFQPEKYHLWKEGKDVAPHPEDDQKKLYAPSKSNSSRPKPPEEVGFIGGPPEPEAE